MDCSVPHPFGSYSLAAVLSALLAAASAMGNEDAARAGKLAFFENKIRPVLVEHCYGCHSAEAEVLGGKLRLDSAQHMLLGGESGSVLMAGDPDASLILQAMRYDGIEMPPDERLPDAVIHDFQEWIANGAVDPRKAKEAEPLSEISAAEQPEALWSLQPPQLYPLPEVEQRKWPRQSLDYFVLSHLEAAGRSPAGDAAPQDLIKRLHFDLIGLQPTHAQIVEFTEDWQAAPEQAVERLVDRLLASPEYGVRWGRHWLDIARYAESNGNDGLGRNPTFPHAWRYRDYVIECLNRDVGYDRFLTEQIAGDLLPAASSEARDRQLIATGFLALAAKPAKAMNADFDMDVVADQIDVIGRGVLGLSVGCARCHDHKFDPIPARDYYALAGIFTSSETMWGVAANEKLTAPPTDLHILQAAEFKPPPEDFVETVLVLESDTGLPKQLPKPKWEPGTPLAMGVRDRPEPIDCKININGDSTKLGAVVPRGVLSVGNLDQIATTIQSDQSGRIELAKWLTDRRHPLTARVMVNRIWLHLCGEAIVSTPDDFGTYGARPTHPELLDHLAVRFTDGDWSIKQLIRSIVLSRTYQLSSRKLPQAPSQHAAAPLKLVSTQVNEVQPPPAPPGESNDFYYRQRRRLDAETLRDRMLQVSGQLDHRAGDGSIIRHRDILINLAGNLHQPSNFRSVYLCYLRSSPPPELAAFDLPDFTAAMSSRPISTVPGQALHLLNSPFVIEQANQFARLLGQQPDCASDAPAIRWAWRRAFGREPESEESKQAAKFLRTLRTHADDEQQVWSSFCQALLVSNEFRYVD